MYLTIAYYFSSVVCEQAFFLIGSQVIQKSVKYAKNTIYQAVVWYIISPFSEGSSSEFIPSLSSTCIF